MIFFEEGLSGKVQLIQALSLKVWFAAFLGEQ